MARRSSAETRAAILDATRSLLKSDPNHVSVDAVVAAAGCTPPTLYYYFDTKEALLHEACAIEYRDFAVELAAATREIGDEDGLLAMGVAYLRWGHAHPAEYQLLFMTRQPPDPGGNPTHSESGDFDLHDIPGLGDLVSALDRAVEQGYRIPNTSAAAFELWAVVHGFTTLSITDPNIPLELIELSLRHACDAVMEAYRP